MGEDEFKEDVGRIRKLDEDDDSAPYRKIGTCSTEAFAHTMLENNYFAWLCDMRSLEDDKELKTEYDTKVQHEGDNVSAADSMLGLGNEICNVSFDILSEQDDDFAIAKQMRIERSIKAFSNEKPAAHKKMIEIEEEINKENAGGANGTSTTTKEQDDERERK